MIYIIIIIIFFDYHNIEKLEIELIKTQKPYKTISK